MCFLIFVSTRKSFSGAESTYFCIYIVSPPSSEFADWSGRQVGETASAAQHAVGYDLSSRNTRSELNVFCYIICVSISRFWTFMEILELAKC